LPIHYVGRPERASPAEGSAEHHAIEQARIVAAVFEGTDGKAGATSAASTNGAVATNGRKKAGTAATSKSRR
jgi:hypothetical protein